ncbi:MAG: TolC family protein [Acidobacteria bacterium]|nr:TolC family protein [Acidobacteriota bacterium]MDW7985196.1 TolC family protein [Acidobacteriota bacterium]
MRWVWVVGWFFCIAGQRPIPLAGGTPTLLYEPGGRTGEVGPNSDLPPRVLTLAEAVALALRRNGELQARRSEVEAARGRARQMVALPNPEVETELLIVQERILGLQQPIRWPAQTRALRRLGELNTEEAVTDYRLKQQELVREVRLQFIEALALRERVAVLAESLQMAREVQATAEARWRQGFGSLEEVTRAAIEVGRIRTQWDTLQGDLTIRRAELRRLIGLDSDVDVTGGLAAVVSELGEFSGNLTAIDTHPWVTQGRVQEALWEARGALERSYRRPVIALGPAVGFLEGGRVSPGIVISVTVPILDRRRGSLQETVARAEAARTTTAYRRRELALRLESLTKRYGGLQQSLEAFRQDVLEPAEDLFRRSQTAYLQGRIPFVTYVDAFRTWVEVRLEYLGLLEELARTAVEVRFITEGPDATSP